MKSVVFRELRDFLVALRAWIQDFAPSMRFPINSITQSIYEFFCILKLFLIIWRDKEWRHSPQDAVFHQEIPFRHFCCPQCFSSWASREPLHLSLSLSLSLSLCFSAHLHHLSPLQVSALLVPLSSIPLPPGLSLCRAICWTFLAM